MKDKNTFKQQTDLSIEDCRRILNQGTKKYKDEEIILIKELMEKLTRIFYDFYYRSLREELRRKK